jgi:hypothetical protein
MRVVLTSTVSQENVIVSVEICYQDYGPLHSEVSTPACVKLLCFMKLRIFWDVLPCS